MLLNLLKKIYGPLLVAITLLSVTSCVTIPPASYSYDQSVGQLFEPPPTLLKDHTYYYRGTSVEPDAIIAVDNRFSMQSKVWSKVDITQETLNKWAFWIDTYQGWWSCPYRGVKLLAPDGTQVGVGYSRWTFSVIKTPEPGAVVIYPPRALGACTSREEREDR